MKQSKLMQKRVSEYNQSQVEERKNLPNLFDAIKLAQQGDMETMNLFFYGYKVIEKYPYEGKMQSYEVNKVKFWDKPTDVFLRNIKKKYCKAMTTNEMTSFSGRKMSAKVNIAHFEEEEIDTFFYEYILQLVSKIELNNFIKGTESETLNALRYYIRVDFENNFLKKENNARLGIVRKTIDGVVYYVKTKPEEVLFDDIYCGRDDEGQEIHFLDVVAHGDVHVSWQPEDMLYTPKKFIEEKIEESLTEKQLDKWNKLIKYVEENGIDNLIDSYTGKIKKSEVSRILFPHRKTTSTVREIDTFVASINKRLEKKLTEAGMKFKGINDKKPVQQVKQEEVVEQKNSAVTTYTSGLSEEEVEKYFQMHVDGIVKASIDGRLTWDKGTDSMLPSLPSMLELPFDVYEKWINGSVKTKREIVLEYHNPDKFKLRAGNKENVKVQEPKQEKVKRYITPQELEDIRRESQSK